MGKRSGQWQACRGSSRHRRRAAGGGSGARRRHWRQLCAGPRLDPAAPRFRVTLSDHFQELQGPCNPLNTAEGGRVGVSEPLYSPVTRATRPFSKEEIVGLATIAAECSAAAGRMK